MNTNTNTWRSVSANELMLLGKTAAETAETSGMSLTDSVVRSIGMTKLNQEQVRRVVEAANHEAYNRKFASMDPTLRAVELEGGPADPSAVAERLEIAAMPTIKQSYSDYSIEPAKTASHALSASVPDSLSKTAALHDIRSLHERLKVAHEEFVGQVGATKAYVHDSVIKLASLARDAVGEGAYYEDFERAWGSVSPMHAAAILPVMDIDRAPEGVKVANRRISDGHPLLSAFSTYVKHAEDYTVACEAVRSTEAELVRVDSFLRSC